MLRKADWLFTVTWVAGHCQTIDPGGAVIAIVSVFAVRAPEAPVVKATVHVAVPPASLLLKLKVTVLTSARTGEARVARREPARAPARPKLASLRLKLKSQYLLLAFGWPDRSRRPGS